MGKLESEQIDLSINSVWRHRRDFTKEVMIEPGWITRHPIQGFPKQQHIQKYPSKYQKYVFKGHLGMVWSNWNHSKRASQAEPRRLQRHRPETICLTY